MKFVNAERDTRHDVVLTEWSTTAACGHLYWAFTEGLGDWLGDPSSMSMAIEAGVAFCIDAKPEWGGGAHYARFVDLRQDRRIEMKWIGESLGGVESDVVIEIWPTARGSAVSIAHAGLPDPAARAMAARLWDGAHRTLEAIIVSSQPRR